MSDIYDEAARLRSEVRRLSDELEFFKIGHDRYETARRMNPKQWGAAWKLNISTGKGFDQIIDDMRPFVRPDAMAKDAK